MRFLAVFGKVVLALSVPAIVARIYLVQVGVLYGTSAVSRVDGIVAGAVGFGLAGLAAGRALKHAKQQSQAQHSSNDEKPPAIADRVATLTAIASVIAVVVSVINLFSPVDLVGQTKPTCSGAHTQNTAYVGITTGPDGNNSRGGPARSFPANGRFARDCSIGFSAYCPGDPIKDMAGTNEHQVWLTSRWLLVAKQPAGWKSWLARRLSGEKSDVQFVADANVAPATKYEGLGEAPHELCKANYLPPGKAVLAIFNVDKQTLTARADHAVNMGFATWTPPGQGFVDENAYQQIFDADRLAEENPGATSAGGIKTVAWAYHGSLKDGLRARRSDGASAPAMVVVMAIPCISDNLPAPVSTAATATYDIASGVNPKRQTRSMTGYDAERLARAACQANT